MYYCTLYLLIFKLYKYNVSCDRCIKLIHCIFRVTCNFLKRNRNLGKQSKRFGCETEILFTYNLILSDKRFSTFVLLVKNKFRDKTW